MYDDTPNQMNTQPTARNAFERLQGDFGLTDELPKRAKFNLVLGDIHTKPDVFQHREQGPDTRWENDLHISILESAISREPTERLDPITVWCCGGQWIVLDGHYRLEAYARYAKDKGVPQDKFAVPCMAFKGKPLEAWDFAAVINKKTTEPLTATERSNVMWKRVCLSLVDGKWITSKATLEVMGLVKSNTISRMRSVLLAILEKGLMEDNDPMGLSWIEATEIFRGDLTSGFEPDWEEGEDPLIQVWADRLARTFGKCPLDYPPRFFQALERYSPKLFEDLTEYLTPRVEDF